MILVMALVMVFAGCSPVEGPRARSGYDLCVQGVHRTDAGALRACGRITPEFVNAIEGQLTPQDREIILTSGGGATESAMRLARLLNQRDVGVRARQFCLSACSTYVLLTAPRVSIDPYTMVAFHYTGAFNLSVIGARSGMRPDAPALRPVGDERNFYSEFGLDPDLLTRFSMAIEPACLGTRTRQSGGRERYLNYRSAWFIPNPSEAATLFRGRLTGYWPASKAEAEAILRPTIGDPQAKLVYGWPKYEATAPLIVARTLPECAS